MIRYKITIEYDGNSFHGWQKQKYYNFTIQETIEKAIFNFSGEKVTLFCAGRTDSGVHAFGQVAHFDMKKKFELYKIRNGLNFYLKLVPIVIINVEIVDNKFHARLSAKKRYYEYRIVNRFVPVVLGARRLWQIFNPLDINIMRKASKYLVGKHNFSSFCSKNCQSMNLTRTIDNISIIQNGDYIYIKISAISFLHNQVRIIVGTLVEFGKNKVNPEKILSILEKRKRNAAGVTAPPYGLYLMKIDY